VPDAASVGLVVVAILLVAVVAFSGVLPILARRRASRAARTRMSKAVTDGSDAKRSPKDRAAALVKAGRTALDELDSARLAARYSEWAHKLDPTDPDVVALMVVALTKARRYHALERHLWVSLDGASDPRTAPALTALTALYEGGLHRPERASALRKLAAGAEDRSSARVP
jgi:hypothetical protein